MTKINISGLSDDWEYGATFFRHLKKKKHAILHCVNTQLKISLIFQSTNYLAHFTFSESKLPTHLCRQMC